MDRMLLSRSICRKAWRDLAVFIFICLMLCPSSLSAVPEQELAEGVMETLDRLDLTPEERELFLQQKYWLGELFVGASQEEAEACLILDGFDVYMLSQLLKPEVNVAFEAPVLPYVRVFSAGMDVYARHTVERVG